MKKQEAQVYLHPSRLKKLKLKISNAEKDKIISGEFISSDGDIFPITDGIPDFTWPKELLKIDEETRKTYSKLADEYDKFAHLPFLTFKSDENEIREKMIDKMCIKSGDVVLEIGCGDGRGAEHIAKRLKGNGKLYLQELSRPFLLKAIQRLKKYKLNIEYSVANASYLPFPDNYFNCAHHFGGINTFSEVKRCLAELARVVKPGGKIVVGDESMGHWLRNTQFGKIMMNSNPLFRYEIPFADIPVNACDVKVEWIMMGAFFVLEFTVGVGEPEADYHIPIPSERGGTHWTRYYGHLEGISDATKKIAYQAQKKANVSMHEWLDRVVKNAATKQLKRK